MSPKSVFLKIVISAIFLGVSFSFPEDALANKKRNEITAKSNHEVVLISDSLHQHTEGTIQGEIEFVNDGGVKSKGGKIVYDAGRLITNGSFEADIKGWAAPALEIDKSHPLPDGKLKINTPTTPKKVHSGIGELAKGTNHLKFWRHLRALNHRWKKEQGH